MNPELIKMARHHRAADMLESGHFEMNRGKACSVGCFTAELGFAPSDFAALAKWSGLPEWAHRFQEKVFEGLPNPERLDWHVQFAERAETVTDWPEMERRIKITALEIALPHDTSEGKVVQRVLDLLHRDDVTEEEWSAARKAAWAEARAAERAAAATGAAAAWAEAAAEAAARAAAWAAAEAEARDDAWRKMRDVFLADME